MAAPNKSPAKCEVRSVIRFLNAKGERLAEIHKQTVAVYGNVMNLQNVTKWCSEFSEGRTDVHDEQRSGRPSLISLRSSSRNWRRNSRKSTRDDKRVASHHSRSVLDHNSWSCDRKLRVQKIVGMLGVQNVNGRSQNEKDGFRAEVSHSLHTGRSCVSGRHCDWR